MSRQQQRLAAAQKAAERQQQMSVEEWMKTLPKVDKNEDLQQLAQLIAQDPQAIEIVQRQANFLESQSEGEGAIASYERMKRFLEQVENQPNKSLADGLMTIWQNPDISMLQKMLWFYAALISNVILPKQNFNVPNPALGGQQQDYSLQIADLNSFADLGVGNFSDLALVGQFQQQFPEYNQFAAQELLSSQRQAITPQITEEILEDGTVVTTIKSKLSAADLKANLKTSVSDSIFDEFDGVSYIVTVEDTGSKIKVSVQRDSGGFIEDVPFTDLSGVDVGTILNLGDGNFPHVSFEPLGANGEIVINIDWSLIPSGDGLAKVEYDRSVGLMNLVQFITQQVSQSLSSSATPSAVASVSSTGSISISVPPSLSSSLTKSITSSLSGTLSASETLIPSVSGTSIPSVSGTSIPSVSGTPSSSESASVSISISPDGTRSVTITLSASASKSFTSSISSSVTPLPSPSSPPSLSASSSETTSISISNSNSDSPSVIISFSASESKNFLASLSPSPFPSLSNGESASFVLSPEQSASLSSSIAPSLSKVSSSISPTPTPQPSNQSGAGESVKTGSANTSFGLFALLFTLPLTLMAYCAHKKRSQGNQQGQGDNQRQGFEIPQVHNDGDQLNPMASQVNPMASPNSTTHRSGAAVAILTNGEEIGGKGGNALQ